VGGPAKYSIFEIVLRTRSSKVVGVRMREQGKEQDKKRHMGKVFDQIP
jgi:hypothetical protein